MTSYCEDSPEIGTFQYRLIGFQNPPTDYYPRPFFMAAAEQYSNANPNCFGSEKIYEYHLDLARKIYEQYTDRSKFIFHFAGKVERGREEEERRGGEEERRRGRKWSCEFLYL